MNIQLSISLLASDRPAALERCLDSLRPLLMQVPSELIVVATGTDAGVREIATRYTDQIIPFTWCDDFSAARNAGLKAAKGEWFMYLDDDEWFEDVSEIRDFFQTGEYHGYGTAFYRVRNYLDWDGIRYFDFHAFRMARIDPGIAFQNPIHEELVPRRGETKFFEAYVHHYGYIVGEKKESAGKTSRNIPMLLKNIRKNPDYIKNYVQLTREYYMRKELGKAEEYCRKGRRLCRGKAGAEWYVQWFQVYQADIQAAKGDAEAARKAIISILEKEHPGELTRLCLYRKLLLLCTQLKKYDETIHYGLEFENLLACMEKTPELWEQQSYGDINKGRIQNPEELAVGRLRCAEAALHLNDSGQAAHFLELLNWEDESWIQRYYPLFDTWKSQHAAAFQKVLGQITANNPYLLFQRSMLLDGDAESDQKPGQFLQCMEGTVSPWLRLQIIREAALSGMGLSRFAGVMDLDTWRLCMQQLVEKLSLPETDRIHETVNELKGTAFLHGLWLEILLREKQLIRKCLVGRELIKDLSEYTECVLTYYKEQYQEKMFQKEKRNLLPEYCRFALLVSDALQSIRERKLPEAVSRFRSALQFHPAMTGVIREIIRYLKDSMDNPALNAGTDFEVLAGQMKASLSTLVEQGYYQEAMSVVQQLVPLLPEDLEILRLRQKLLRM